MSERGKEKTHGVFQCLYRGFIHTDSPDGKSIPGEAAVQKAHSMLSRKRIKKTRKLHPLFGRGFDTPLLMTIQSGAVRVDLPSDGKTQGAVVMNCQLHKIAFISHVANAVGIVVKRPGNGKFKCHLFLLDDEDGAVEVCRLLKKVTNEAFNRLRRVSCRLRSKQIKEGPPAVATRKPSLADEDQPWFHGPLSRAHAEDILQDYAAIDGLFLVRQREGKENEFAISFVVGGMVFHNRVERNKEGLYVNSKGTVFPSLRIMISEYQNRHPDMQCILTEFVPRDRVGGGVEYANAAVINQARKTKKQASFSRWSESDVRQVLENLDQLDLDGDDAPQDDTPKVEDLKVAPSDVQFDPIFDDVRFGYVDSVVWSHRTVPQGFQFGNEFVSLVMSGNTEVIEPSEDVNLDSECFDLSSMMTHLDQEDEC
ncbi:hypothetical protein PTSG_09413 [Salpingoeca rosetta]|uniref:SH2 domain-containing protein n=1 Tax=Salpingoeca rosetta (strain ATCC 50818 / BSB-021) TaxID=946362 RepID=F2UMJ8_SALR5|nr:uncharacterized protein PTSG_09413 [Salpingoeca rosetta]EGD78347.1 hypothetical protein PTSG_09413 [Salpingoeca rosetta]|eukprot:XP_004989670.1 hypothetical protein PTSG_09413 [Salpingoeca rosetta]